MNNLGLMVAVAKKYGSGGNGVGLTEEQVNNIAKIPEIKKYIEQNKTELDDIAIKIEGLEQGGNLAVRDVLDGEIFEIGSDGEEIPPSEMYGEIIISTTSLYVNEDSSISFTVALDKAPTNNQVVKINVNNAYCTLDKTSLTFTASNYNVAQTVTVIGVHDNSSYVNKTTTITVSSSNVSSKTINVNIKNIDTPPEGGTDDSIVSDVYKQWNDITGAIAIEEDDFIIDSNDFTIITKINNPTDEGNPAFMVLSRENAFKFEKTWQGKISFNLYGNTFPTGVTNDAYINKGDSIIAWMREGNVIKTYLNNVELLSTSIGSFEFVNTGVSRIGISNKILKNLLLYRRALTIDELTQNFNALGGSN